MKTVGFRQRLADIIDADRGHSKVSKMYDRCMGIVIVLSLVPLMFLENDQILECISWFTVIVFLIDFIARWYVSPFDKYKVGRQWWRRYPFTFMGLVDLLSVMPIFGLISYKFSLFKIFRLARVTSIVKFSRYSDKDELLMRVLKKNKTILKAISLLIIFFIFITSLLIFNVEPHYNPMTGEETFANFMDAIYWTVVTLTTVGYGDIYPVTMLGKMISICSMFLGFGIIATISSVVTAGIIDEINKRTKQ